MRRITQQQLESYLWGAATLLRGTIDAGDYKQFIFPLLFYKRLCDVFDEETLKALRDSGGDEDFAQFPENHRFQIPQEAHWREVRKATRDVGRALQQSMRAIETANQNKLYNIFGDAQWTNKDRLSDSMLRDLVEHLSTLELTVANLPEDELGQGYEFLIKKFADDSGHTAAEFYTNRTVVHLMTEMLDVQPGESVYDPTCGSGGMLLSCVAHLRKQGKEWRNVKLFGQERNLMTSSIARMNCFLHGIEDFRVERGDTLAEPKLVEGDRLMKFDVVLANPPYSIKQWDREAFASDPWGRNLYGTPPQGRADYAFQQHILQSLKSQTGRCAVLWPHGVLFRKEEAEMRRKMIDADLVECVLGLGPNLFYNATMESCVVVCRTQKPKSRRGKVLLINAVNEVTRERGQSFLTGANIERILKAYRSDRDESGFSRWASLDEIRSNKGDLSLPLYVSANGGENSTSSAHANDLTTSLRSWLESSAKAAECLNDLGILSKKQEQFSVATGLTALPLLDRRKWMRVRFGDVVENLNKTCDPKTSSVDRFIGLEHLEPGWLHVRNWGNVADGTTFTRRCRSGQVLFGKRRAYQRKVAVADFDAVVSGDIYVLAAKNEQLLSELLPFLCLSERFFQHAVGTSAGSLSPRTNWNSLASFKFDLPPLEQQRRIAEILWAVDEAMQSAVGLKNSLAMTRDAWLSDRLERVAKDRFVALKDVSTSIRNGMVGKVADHYVEKGIPYLVSKNVRRNRLKLDELSYVSEEFHVNHRKSQLQPLDILTVQSGHVGETCVVPPDFGVANCHALIISTPKTDLVDPYFVAYYLNSQVGQKQLRRLFIGSALLHINTSDLQRVKVPLLPLDEQREIASWMTTMDARITACSNNFDALLTLRDACLSELTTFLS